MASCKAVFLLGLLLFSSLFLNLTVCSASEFQVGGDQGWAIPSSKDGEFYNEWASKNRFKVNDTLHFAYKKDSVLVVTDNEYDKCHSSHPLFFANNGQTTFTFGRSGLFYFISGVSGHCERGLKMIIKVLEPESPPPPEPTKKSSASTQMASATFVLIIMSFFGTLFM